MLIFDIKIVRHLEFLGFPLMFSGKKYERDEFRRRCFDEAQSFVILDGAENGPQALVVPVLSPIGIQFSRKMAYESSEASISPSFFVKFKPSHLFFFSNLF